MSSLTSSEYLNPVSTQTWANGRHLVRCLKVIRETADVLTYCFSMQEPVLFFFKPGQFVTLELEIDGEQVMRSYTIASAPSIPYSLSIAYRRQDPQLAARAPNGRRTDRRARPSTRFRKVLGIYGICKVRVMADETV